MGSATPLCHALQPHGAGLASGLAWASYPGGVTGPYIPTWVTAKERCLAAGSCLVTMSLFFPLVAAMLESEPIQGLSSSCPPGHRWSSGAPAHTLPELLQQLGSFHAALGRHGLSPSVGHQALRQLLFLISGTTLNYLLLRKDTCSWSRGIQLRSVPTQDGCLRGSWDMACVPLPDLVSLAGTTSASWSSGCGQRGCSRAGPVRCWSPWSRLPSCCR